MKGNGATYTGRIGEACGDAGRKGRGEKGRGKKEGYFPRGPT